MEFIVKNVEELQEVAKNIIELNKTNRIFTFFGEMGAGKTTFIKAICTYLGLQQNANSPTFSIVNEYLLASGEPLYHFDFYRIKNITEVYDIGYEDYFYSSYYCFIEWPEKVESLLPNNCVHVHIIVNSNEERIIQF